METKQTEDQIFSIDILEVSTDTLKEMLQFLYKARHSAAVDVKIDSILEELAHRPLD